MPLQVLQQPTQHKHGLTTHHLLAKVHDVRLVHFSALTQRLRMALQQKTATEKAADSMSHEACEQSRAA
jgi:hypothetical protein